MIDEGLKQSFLSLVRLGIGTEPSTERRFLADLDWERMKALADAQGLSAVVLDGLDKVPSSAYDMPAMMKKQWIGRCCKDTNTAMNCIAGLLLKWRGFITVTASR